MAVSGSKRLCRQAGRQRRGGLELQFAGELHDGDTPAGRRNHCRLDNSGASEKILVPGTLGAQNSLSLSNNTSGYELVTLQFDGSNFRLLSVTPLTANASGMSVPIGTPASSSTACQTGALQSDGSYLYLCSAPNIWKRAALFSF